MANSLKECPNCGRALSDSLSGVVRRVPKSDRPTEPPKTEDTVVFAVFALVVLVVPPLILGLSIGTPGWGIGLVISSVILVAGRLMLGHG